MALSNPESLNFGLSAIRLRRNGLLVGQSALVGNVTAEWNTGMTSTMAAASSYPSSYRNTSSEGAGTLSLLSRPRWVDGDVAGGAVTSTAASATPVLGAITDASGTSLASDLTASVKTGAVVSNHYDFVVEATGAAMLRVSYIGDRNEQEIVNVAISDTATEIGSTGIELTGSASPNYNVGDQAAFSVEAPHGGKTHITIPQFRTGRYYELTIWGAEGGADDSPEKIVMPKVYVVGANFAKTAKEMPAVEIPFNLCAPDDGSEVVQRTIWQPEA